ncbi:hypothetical protein IMZ48_39520, partial [Candidatus Bathyarchaeota archaeon]|nr:hypothetical protein [Candidatus Bathyarchaeota archaeon]
LQRCSPHCSKCYYNSKCRAWAKSSYYSWKRGWSTEHRNKCALKPRGTDVEMGPVFDPQRSFGPGIAEKTVCRMCAAVTPDERRVVLEARDERELGLESRRPLACWNCNAMLGGRAIWWVCRDSSCVSECTSQLHPGWGEEVV